MGTFHGLLLVSLHAFATLLVEVLLVAASLFDASHLSRFEVLALLSSLPMLILLSSHVGVRHLPTFRPR